MKSESKRLEYVLSQHGQIFRGTYKRIKGTPWNFGQAGWPFLLFYGHIDHLCCFIDFQSQLSSWACRAFCLIDFSLCLSAVWTWSIGHQSEDPWWQSQICVWCRQRYFLQERSRLCHKGAERHGKNTTEHIKTTAILNKIVKQAEVPSSNDLDLIVCFNVSSGTL